MAKNPAGHTTHHKSWLPAGKSTQQASQLAMHTWHVLLTWQYTHCLLHDCQAHVTAHRAQTACTAHLAVHTLPAAPSVTQLHTSL
jgi:hypothetical protein